MTRLPKPPIDPGYIPRASPETLAWLRGLDSYCQQTYGRRNLQREVEQARAQLRVIVQARGGTEV